MRAALINPKTGAVENVIVADASKDRAPDSYVLVAVEDSENIGVGWLHSRKLGFTMGPELKRRIEHEESEATREEADFRAKQVPPDEVI